MDSIKSWKDIVSKDQPFEDPEFPPISISLYDTKDCFTDSYKDLEWRRVSEICGTNI
jgi:hypothetical protein